MSDLKKKLEDAKGQLKVLSFKKEETEKVLAEVEAKIVEAGYKDAEALAAEVDKSTATLETEIEELLPKVQEILA